MKANRKVLLSIGFLSFLFLFCSCNHSDDTIYSISDAKSISSLLGVEKQEFFEKLKLDMEQDTKPYAYPQETVSDGWETYRFNQPIAFENRESMVEVNFQNGLCCRISFLFTNTEANGVGEGNAYVAYNFTKELREDFGALYGETDTYPGLSDKFDSLTNYEQAMQKPGKYHEEWEVKKNAAIAKQIFGERLANQWENRIFLVLSYENIYQPNENMEAGFVRISYTPPTHGETKK